MWTGASIKDGGGLILPAPYVKLLEYRNITGQSDYVDDFTISNEPIRLFRPPQIQVFDLPKDAYKPEYDLKLELLWYRKGHLFPRILLIELFISENCLSRIQFFKCFPQIAKV